MLVEEEEPESFFSHAVMQHRMAAMAKIVNFFIYLFFISLFIFFAKRFDAKFVPFFHQNQKKSTINN